MSKNTKYAYCMVFEYVEKIDVYNSKRKQADIRSVYGIRIRRED
jgi:hypothetical protein